MDKSVFYLLVSDAFWYSSAIVLTCFIICLFWLGNKCFQRQHENTIFRAHKNHAMLEKHKKSSII